MPLSLEVSGCEETTIHWQINTIWKRKLERLCRYTEMTLVWDLIRGLWMQEIWLKRSRGRYFSPSTLLGDWCRVGDRLATEAKLTV